MSQFYFRFLSHPFIVSHRILFVRPFCKWTVSICFLISMRLFTRTTLGQLHDFVMLNILICLQIVLGEVRESYGF